MNNQVLEYFVDLENRKVDKENNVILLSSRRVKEKRPRNHCNYYIIDKIPAFIKGEEPAQILLSTATSKMYNEIGIPTPLICPVKANSEVINLGLASQDVTALTKLGYEVVKADKTEFFNNHYLRNINHYAYSNWVIFYTPKNQEKLKQFMTEECFDKFVSLHLADELRTDNDRHWGNFFFYKKKGADKFEGIIPIDFENVQIINSYNPHSQKAFNKFLNSHSYRSFTIEEFITFACPYSERIRQLRDVINDGMLKPKHIETIRKELEYDLPKSIKELGKKYNLKTAANLTYDKIAKLWLYNRKTIGRDLGM